MAAPLLEDITPVQVANDAIARIRRAGTLVAHQTAMECELVRQRAARKVEAIKRIMADPEGNPLTGRPHSATSAEQVAETDPLYAEYLQQCCKATVATILARSDAVASRLEAQLALAMVLNDDGEEDDG